MTQLCRSAYESLHIFLRNTIRLPSGIPGVIMAIQTFGKYPDRFHPHIHALVSDEKWCGLSPRVLAYRPLL